MIAEVEAEARLVVVAEPLAVRLLVLNSPRFQSLVTVRIMRHPPVQHQPYNDAFAIDLHVTSELVSR